MANKRHTPTQSSFLSKQGLNIVSRKEDLSTMAARPTTLIRQQHTMDISTQHRPRWERWETRRQRQRQRQQRHPNDQQKTEKKMRGPNKRKVRPSLVLLPSILTTPRWSTTWPMFPPLGGRPAPTGMMTIRFSMSLITRALLPLRPIRPITRSPHQRACVHLQSLLRVGPLPKAHPTL